MRALFFSASATSQLVSLRCALILALGGCGSSGSSLASPASPAAGAAIAAAPSSALSATTGELSPALAPLSWWLGTWDAEDGSSREHWAANGGALFGVALDAKGGFEVLIVDDGEDGKPADGVLRLFAMPGGGLPVEFQQREVTGQGVRFGNDAHDFPKLVSYRREAQSLRAEISGDGKRIPFGFQRAEDPPRALELEAADRAFAADTATRGVEGWVAAFEPEGWMHGGGQKRVGAEPIRATMGPFLGGVRVDWAPVTSARRGDLGFTLGKATFTDRKDGSSWKGVYVTMWHFQPDGTWKVRFDTGRRVNEQE
jgi:ketosteroid isomerase-like protein